MGTSWRRAAFYAATLAILVTAAGFAPLPYVRYVPGEPQEIVGLIQIDGVETTELSGTTALLTVFLDPVTPHELYRAWRDPTQGLIPAEHIAPNGRLTPDFFANQREMFSRQFQVAAAVGLEAAGVEVNLRTMIVVDQVQEDGPSAGRLQPGDRIRAADGRPITEGRELQAVARAGADGDVVRLDVERDGEDEQVEVVLGVIPGSNLVGFGVVVQTVSAGFDTPFEIGLADTRIGGPSAGLMTALTVYDLFADEDLLRGRVVVGTGTIEADGTVGRIGGVGAKIRAAVAFGADVVLVPVSQVEEALEADPPDDVRIVGVETFEDALDALRAGSGAAG